ncbi:hypothetical protein [Maritimibacter dapengensis]|uniref:PH domain-containing protein n=1 Tax=Maritimibacter dapengensis TaxID=2836868 RepID=A0ABS6T541_9RHOB|nr:hypothetical protein [Maritimibacter dapengensis]MBV7380349.1 hypothetical protein [Maritimibacter dapengensis]
MKTETYGYTRPAARPSRLRGSGEAIAFGAGVAALAGAVGVIGAGLLGALAAAGWYLGRRGHFGIARGHGEIRLDLQGIVVPTGREALRLSYKGISDIEASRRDGDRHLVIRHMDGTIRISASTLVNDTDFDRLWASLERRVGLHRGYRY